MYLLLIILPAAVGLILGFTLPKIVMAAWKRGNQANKGQNIEKKERRLLCIR